MNIIYLPIIGYFLPVIFWMSILVSWPLTLKYWHCIIIIMSRYKHGISDPLSPPLSIVHCFRQVIRTTSRIDRELLYVGLSWSSFLCSFMWRGPQEYIPYELVPTSSAVSRMSGSSDFDSFRDGWYVAVQLLLFECCFQDLFYIAGSILV